MTCSYTLRNNITLSAKAKALLTVPQTFVKGTYRIKERMPTEYPISVFFNKIQSPRASEMPLRVAQPAYDFEPEPDVDDYDAPNIFPYKKCSECGERNSCGAYHENTWLCEDCGEDEKTMCDKCDECLEDDEITRGEDGTPYCGRCYEYHHREEEEDVAEEEFDCEFQCGRLGLKREDVLIDTTTQDAVCKKCWRDRALPWSGPTGSFCTLMD